MLQPGGEGRLKRNYLVVYEYGQGGTWAFVAASSESQISVQFPELKIVATPPEWMTSKEIDTLKRTASYDLDDPRGLLADISARRKQSPAKKSASG